MNPEGRVPSTPRSVPQSIGIAVDHVREATRSLIAASRISDEDGEIDRAIEERGRAMEQLRLAFERDGKSLDAETRRSILGSLSIQAQDAEESLRDLQQRIAGQLRHIVEGSQAMQGYAGHSVAPSALDRSG